VFKLRDGRYIIVGASKDTISKIVSELVRLGLKRLIEFE